MANKKEEGVLVGDANIPNEKAEAKEKPSSKSPSKKGKDKKDVAPVEDDAKTEQQGSQGEGSQENEAVEETLPEEIEEPIMLPITMMYRGKVYHAGQLVDEIKDEEIVAALLTKLIVMMGVDEDEVV